MLSKTFSMLSWKELDKACFHHDLVFGDWFTKKSTSDKMLHDKAFNIAKNPKYDG